jgi:hypothetical protein
MIRYLLLFDSCGLVFVGRPLWREDGSFVYVAGHRQRSLFWFRVPWDSWPYLTLWDLTLPFSSPLSTRRLTVEVLEPLFSKSESKSHCDWRSVDQQVLVSSPIWGSWPDITIWQLRSWFSRAPSLMRGRVCLMYMLLALAIVVFLGSESLGTRDHIILSQIWNFPFRRLLRLAVSRWMYSNLPPHGWWTVSWVESILILRPTVSGPVFLGVKQPSADYDQIFISVGQLRVSYVGRSLWREDGSVVYNCCWSSPAQSFSGSSPEEVATIFYCLRFETFLFVASYDLEGYGGGFRPRLHTETALFQVKVKVTLRLTVNRNVTLTLTTYRHMQTQIERE